MINEQIEHKLKTVDEMLQVAELNARHEFWNSAVNRLYYACFHAVSALLISMGHQDVKTHGGVKTLFSQYVIREGLMDRQWSYFYSSMFDSRSDADYDDFQDYDRESVEEMLPKTQEFVTLVKNLIKP